jgi:hypothetical protein
VRELSEHKLKESLEIIFRKRWGRVCPISQKLALYKAKIFGTEIQTLANLGHFINGVNFIVLLKQFSF